MASRRCVAIIVLAGCGRIGFDASGDGGASDRTAMPLSCTTEPFDTGVPAGWAPYTDTAGFSAAVTNGELAIQLVPNATGYAGINTDNGIDFTRSAVSVAVNAVVAVPNGETYLAVYVSNDAIYYMAYEASRLFMGRRVAGVITQTNITYNPALHRSWRIAHDADANVLRFSTSADGAMWTEQYQVDATIAVDALFIELSAGTYQGGGASPGTPRFDNFELCVP